MPRSFVSRRCWTPIAAILAAAMLTACVTVGYVRPGEHVEPRAGEAVVFTRIRFTHDGREWFPWDPSFVEVMLEVEQHRHFWLRRLDRHAVTPELQPESDGSLALRVPHGDYALAGTDEDLSEASSTTAIEIVALLRVPPDQPYVYAGDLVLVTQYREGWSAITRWLGEPLVQQLPAEAATAAIEAKYGQLRGPPAVSPWCVGPGVPAFAEPDGPDRARELLDRGCPQSR
jgi:hypothetical protein